MYTAESPQPWLQQSLPSAVKRRRRRWPIIVAVIVGGGWGIVGGISALVLASFTRDEIAELAGRTLLALGERAVPFAVGLLEMIAEEES